MFIVTIKFKEIPLWSMQSRNFDGWPSDQLNMSKISVSNRNERKGHFLSIFRVTPHCTSTSLHEPFFHDFGSYTHKDRCIWNKIWRGSWFWDPLASTCSETWRKLRKTKYQSKFFTEPKFLVVEKWNVGNRLKRVFAKIGGCKDHVRGGNRRLKFRKVIEICVIACLIF